MYTVIILNELTQEEQTFSSHLFHAAFDWLHRELRSSHPANVYSASLFLVENSEQEILGKWVNRNGGIYYA